jgi:hypothetical protein
MPVTEGAYGEMMTREIAGIEKDSVRKMFATVTEMRENYTFFVPPVFVGFEDMQKAYKQGLMRAAEEARKENGPEEVFERFIDEFSGLY